MRHIPEICISLCGAVWIVSLVLLPFIMRTAWGAPLRKDWD